MNEKVEQKLPVSQTPAPEVIRVADNLRTDLVLAFAQRRAARAELGEAQQVVERLIAKLDKDGELTKAITTANSLVGRFQQADQKLTASLAAVQAAAGVSLNGYVVNVDTGELTKQQEAPPAPAPAPKKAKKRK